MTLPLAQKIRAIGDWEGATDRCTLGFEARFLRRKVLTSESGLRFLVDLPHTHSFEVGEAIELSDGRLIAVVAAEEALLQITGDNLVRLAWHIGNRHTPCQIEPDRLLIERTPVIAGMLRTLGAEVTEVTETFTPEGGAYGHGRTHGHAHTDIHGTPHENAHAHPHSHD